MLNVFSVNTFCHNVVPCGFPTQISIAMLYMLMCSSYQHSSAFLDMPYWESVLVIRKGCI